MHFNQLLPSLFERPSLFNGNEIAQLSVVLFFTLSGFLISYLLFEEKDRNGSISIKKFYWKRVLRIWPPYYLVVAASFILYPFYKHIPNNPAMEPELAKIFVIYMLIFPNIGTMISLSLTPLRPLWSIGVEEQFYLIWPWLVQKTTRWLLSITLFIVAYVGLKFTTPMLAGKVPGGSLINAFIQISPMHIMAFGALGAHAVKYNWKGLKFVYHPITQLVCWAVYLYSFYSPFQINHFQYEFYSLVFLVIILNVATNARSLITPELKILKFLGKISYGLYVYHFCIMLILSLLIPHHIFNSYVLMSIVIASIILFSTLSYYFYEIRFLRLKGRLDKKTDNNPEDKVLLTTSA